MLDPPVTALRSPILDLSSLLAAGKGAVLPVAVRNETLVAIRAAAL
jgi:hypothetical protein